MHAFHLTHNPSGALWMLLWDSLSTNGLCWNLIHSFSEFVHITSHQVLPGFVYTLWLAYPHKLDQCGSSVNNSWCEFVICVQETFKIKFKKAADVKQHTEESATRASVSLLPLSHIALPEAFLCVFAPLFYKCKVPQCIFYIQCHVTSCFLCFSFPKTFKYMCNKKKKQPKHLETLSEKLSAWQLKTKQVLLSASSFKVLNACATKVHGLLHEWFPGSTVLLELLRKKISLARLSKWLLKQ